MRRTLTTLVAIGAAALLVAAAGPAGAAFPGQNGKIAFVSNRAGSNDIFSANPDGSGLVNLTATAGVDELDPAWSADGRRLAFVRAGALWVMNADGSGQRQLTNSPAVDELDQTPAWSPDGLEIAVARSDISGNWGIWIVPEGGGPARRLTSQLNDAGRDQWPAWSPDGSTIAFSRSTRGFASQLALVPADGSGTVQIVDTGITSSNDHPSWSPDGTRIAVDVNGGEAIVIFEPDGTRVPLGFVLFGQDPEWSPDGSAIVYNTRTGNREIGWAALDGTMSGSVTGGDPAADLSPTWQPAVRPNTPCCGPVSVSPVGPAVTITFSNVTAAGDTTVATSNSGPALPSGFSLGNPPVYYDIATTADVQRRRHRLHQVRGKHVLGRAAPAPLRRLGLGRRDDLGRFGGADRLRSRPVTVSLRAREQIGSYRHDAARDRLRIGRRPVASGQRHDCLHRERQRLRSRRSGGRELLARDECRRRTKRPRTRRPTRGRSVMSRATARLQARSAATRST